MLMASVNIELCDPLSEVYLAIMASRVSSGIAIPLAVATLIPSTRIERAKVLALGEVKRKSLVLSRVKAVREFLSRHYQYLYDVRISTPAPSRIPGRAYLLAHTLMLRIESSPDHFDPTVNLNVLLDGKSGVRLDEYIGKDVQVFLLLVSRDIVMPIHPKKQRVAASENLNYTDVEGQSSGPALRN